MCKSPLLRLLPGLAAVVVLATTTGWTQDATSLGILDFRDETGGQPAGLGQRIATEVRQRILSSHPGILPKMLAAEGHAPSPAGLSVEQLTGLGRKYGVEYVLQGGILSVARTSVDDATMVTIILSGEVIAVQTGAVRSLRVEASGTRAEADGRSVVDLALAQAVGQLIQAVVTEIQSPSDAAPAGQTEAGATVEPAYEEAVADAGQDEVAQTAQQDEELQQLIADAEAALAAGGLTDSALKDVDRALKDLSSVLAEKNDLVQRDESTERIDARIAERSERLRSVLSNAATTGGEYVEEAPEEQRDILARASETADEALSLIQKIKDARALIWGSRDEEEATASQEEYGAAEEETTGEITGAVIDEQGPVAGAEVVDEETGTSATTGEDGTFVLQAIPLRTVARLSVVAKAKRSKLAPLPVVAGRATVADIRLRKGVALLNPGVIASIGTGKARRGTGGLVAGRVLDANGKPVARALVTMKAVGLVRTTSNGEYVFRNVPAGSQRVSVSLPGTKAVSLDVRVQAAKTARADVRMAAAAVAAPARQKSLMSAVGAGATLSGRVRDQRGRPVAGAKVSVLQGKNVVGVLTGREGKYRIAGLRPDEYRVVVSRAGYDGVRQTVRLTPKEHETRDFELRQVSSIVDKLRTTDRSKTSTARPGARAKDRHAAAVRPSATLQGRVTDGKSRQPLAGATIRVERVGTTRSDRNGVYSFGNLPPGTHRVSASRGGYRTVERGVRAQGGQRVTLDFQLAPVPRVLAPGRRRR